MAVDVKSQQASLGCGTLILIALIVMIFSSPRTHEIESEISQLRNEVGVLTQSIQEQTAEIKQMQQQLNQLTQPE